MKINSAREGEPVAIAGLKGAALCWVLYLEAGLWLWDPCLISIKCRSSPERLTHTMRYAVAWENPIMDGMALCSDGRCLSLRGIKSRLLPKSWEPQISETKDYAFECVVWYLEKCLACKLYKNAAPSWGLNSVDPSSDCLGSPCLMPKPSISLEERDFTVIKMEMIVISFLFLRPFPTRVFKLLESHNAVCGCIKSPNG